MRLIVADDALIVREGLTHVLEAAGHDVVGRVAHPERLLAEVADGRPDAVIVDIKMPPTYTDEGLRAAAAIRSRHPRVGVLVLSQYVVPGYASWLLEHAPDRIGYLLKERIFAAGTLDAALRRIVAAETVIDPELVRVLMNQRGRSGPLAALTGRERDVLALMAEGLTDRGIAERLVVSLNTVGTHVQSIFRKLTIPDSAADNRRVLAVITWLQDATLRNPGPDHPGPP